jgi:hypothetical protein
MADEDNKPVPKQEGQIISLIVKDQFGGEVHFKVKSHTKLEKVGAAGMLIPLVAAQMQRLEAHSWMPQSIRWDLVFRCFASAHQLWLTPGLDGVPRCSELGTPLTQRVVVNKLQLLLAMS